MDLLISKVPCERTISARLLAEYDDIYLLKALIQALMIEKKLYPKIALSETVSGYGEKASNELIKHLGMVGKNQYKTLPDKPFKKNNYPLPRDIIARTFCKIGKPALEVLKDCMYNGSYNQKLEAVDAIGFISYYEYDNTLKKDVLELIRLYEKDNLMIWKLIRALQAFDDEKVLEVLARYQNSSVLQHQREATRSIEQIKRRR